MVAPPGFWESLEGQRGNVTVVNHTRLIYLFLVLRFGSGARCLRSQAGLPTSPTKAGQRLQVCAPALDLGLGCWDVASARLWGAGTCACFCAGPGVRAQASAGPAIPPSPFPVLRSWPVRAEFAHLSVPPS